MIPFDLLLDEALEGRKAELVPPDVILFTYSQVAHLAGVSRRTISREVAADRLPVVWVTSRSPRVTLEAYRQWIRTRARRRP